MSEEMPQLGDLPLVIAALKTLGTSHRSIAEAIGVSDMSVSRWSDGRCMPDPARLKGLASFAAVAIDPHARGVGVGVDEARMLRFLSRGGDAQLRAWLMKQLEVVNPLRALRKQHRLTVVTAADCLGITRQYLHELEKMPHGDRRLGPHLRKASRTFSSAKGARRLAPAASA